MDNVSDLPRGVQTALGAFVEAAREAFGPDLSSIVLYGSGAEGRLRATSDLNVLLVLKRFDRERADGIRDSFRLARAEVRLEAMFLLESEIEGAAESFAVKFQDILRRRRVLWGADPFEGLAVSRAAIIQRLDQVLLNLRLRLRERYALLSLREEQLAKVVAEAASPLRSCAASILELEGAAAASPREALEKVAAGLGEEKWKAILERIIEARRTGSLPAGVGPEMVFDLIELTRRLEDRVARIER